MNDRIRARRSSSDLVTLLRLFQLTGVFAARIGVLLALGARPISAQQSAIPQLLVDRTFRAGDSMPSTVYLGLGLTYRVRLSKPHRGLEMRSTEGKPVPFIHDVTTWTDRWDKTELELTPNSDGVIEFRVAGGTAHSKTRFRLWLIHPPYVPLPTLPNTPTQLIPPTPRTPPTPSLPIEIGITERVGIHTAYRDRRIQYADGGAVLEGCVAVRGGHGVLERISGCAIGYSRQGGRGAGQFDFLYSEPHLRILGPQLREGRQRTWGILIRVSRSLAGHETSAMAATIGSGLNVGLGIYAARDNRAAHRGGTQLEAALLLERINGSGIPDPALPQRIAGSAKALTLRVGGGWFF